MDFRSSGCLPDGLKHRAGDSIDDLEVQTHIITADITTQSKVYFPKMAHLYWSDLDKESPAGMVRASMSVPVFFKPFQIDGLPDQGSPATKDWKDLADYRGSIPPSAKFVDGGMISNFPINVFHRETGLKPRKPTFGVKLSAYRESYSNIDSLMDYLGAMVSTMRHDADIEFLVKNPEFKKLICFIDANKEFKWLNFKMSAERQSELFLLGAKKGLEFLKRFKWEEYKTMR